MTAFEDPQRQAEEIAAALEGKRAADGFMVLCPAHADRNPSLHLTVRDGRLLIHCQAGCDQNSVIEALRERNLWAPAGDRPASVASPQSGSRSRSGTGSPPSRRGGLPPVEHVYAYFGADGSPRHKTIRHDGKLFTQQGYFDAGERGCGGRCCDSSRGPQEAGPRWHLRVPKDIRVLYRLPQLLKAGAGRRVYLCEGEKDADRLAAGGRVATTNAMGAKAWLPSYVESLRGFHVVILEDNDEAGHSTAAQKAKALSGVAASVKVIGFRDMHEHADVSDWLDAGHTLEELDELADRTGVWGSEREPRSGIISLQDLLAMNLPPARWAIEGLLPEGLCLFGGKAKMGKSWLALGLGLAIASGGRALGQIPVEGGSVLYLALEDNERRLQTRCMEMLKEAEAPEAMYLALEWPRVDEGGLEAMDAWLSEHPEARLVIVDTLKRIRPIDLGNRSVYEVDYEALQGMAGLAAKHHVAIVVVHHLRKLHAEDPVDAILGSTGLAAAADGIWIMQRTRGEHDAMLYIVHREGEDQELALVWDPTLTLWSLAGTAEEYRLSKERQQILDVLIDASEPLTPKAVASVIDKNYQTTKSLMRKMAIDGTLSTVGTGMYKPAPQHPGQGNRNDSPRNPIPLFRDREAKNRGDAGVTPGDEGLRGVTPGLRSPNPDFPLEEAENGQSGDGDDHFFDAPSADDTESF